MTTEPTSQGRAGVVSIEYLMLADRAEAVNGKLYVMGGGWDRNFVEDFRQPVPLSLAVGFLVPWDMLDFPQLIQISIENSEKKEAPVYSLEATFVARRPPTGFIGDPLLVTLAVPAVAVKFPGPGKYEVIVRLAGGQERRIRVRMLPLSGAAAAQVDIAQSHRG